MTNTELAECYLSYRELACRDGTPYPNEWRSTRLPQLAKTFASLRRFLGNKPLTITSAYRTVTHNRRVNGTRNSRHLAGQALDVARPSSLTIEEFHETVRAWVESGTAPYLGAVGYYQDFVHIDTRTRRVFEWCNVSNSRRPAIRRQI